MVELIVVLAIAALILAIGIPIFATMIHRSRVEGTAREIDLTLLAARLQAIKRGANVGTVLTTDSSISSGPLKNAYQTLLTFVDKDGNGALDAGETVLGTNPLHPAGRQITLAVDGANAATPSTTGATAYFVFKPVGSMQVADKSIYILDTHDNVLQVGVVSASTGRVAVTKRRVSGGTTTYQPPPWQWN